MSPRTSNPSSVVDTALFLVTLGFYVGPLKPGTKNPGSRLGSGWHRKTSTKRSTILRWFREHPGDGLFLHLGRSGLIAFDLDIDSGLGSLPPEVAAALRGGIFQRSRGTGDRGHYVFRTEEAFGNSAGGFSSWGDVRCGNGVIVLAPTVHPTTKKPYVHVRGEWSEVPELPAQLRTLLRTGGENQQPALSLDELQVKLKTLQGGNQHEVLEERCRAFRLGITDGSSRHESMLVCLLRVFQDAKEGLYPAGPAIERLRKEFAVSFNAAPSGKRTMPTPGEFDGLVRWAAAQLTPVEATGQLFESTPELRMIRRYAEEYSVAPLGLFAVGISRALACLPPNRVLPAIIGTPAPLNYFVALVGKSGAGKGATEDLATEVFMFPESVQPDVYIGRPGSSEGITKMYGRMESEKDGKRRVWKAVYKVTRVLASLPEVDTLASPTGRDGGLISATLREAWSGSRIGNDYAHEENKFPLGAKRYRFCLIVGVQPERADFVLQGQGGGLPQRFIWASVTIPQRTYVPPTGDRSDLTPIELPATANETSDTDSWKELMLSNATSAELIDLKVPKPVIAQILKARELALLSLGGEWEGHRLLVQAKTAMGIAIISGRTDGFDMSHWEQAGMMLSASDATLAEIQRSQAQRRVAERTREAREAGQLRTIRSDAEETARIRQVSDRILEILRGKDVVPQSVLRRALAQGQRNVFDQAIASLLETDRISRKRRTSKNGEKSTYYSVIAEE